MKYDTLKKGVKRKRKWKTFKRRGLANQRTSGKPPTDILTLMQTTETGSGENWLEKETENEERRAEKED